MTPRVRDIGPSERGRICQHDGCEQEATTAVRTSMVRYGSGFKVWRLWCDSHVVSKAAGR